MVDPNGNILGVAPLTATSDFMKFPVTFETNLSFSAPKGIEASLVFYNENPSGLPENSASISLPVKLSVEITTVELYFGRNGEETCTELYPVERQIIKTPAIARATIEELLKGPTQEEKAQGFFTSINEGVKINSLTIVDGVAKIDFDETLEAAVGGSCRVSAIRQEITQTLKQFPTVKEVIISINGRTEDILQP